MDILKKFGPFANANFNKLFSGQFLSHLGDAVIQMSLIAWAITLSENSEVSAAGGAMATVLFSFMLPQFLFSSIAGICVDKFHRKTILFLSTLFKAAVAFLIAYLTLKSTAVSIFMIYGFSFLVGIGATFFYPAKMAVLTNVVDSAQLKFANAVNVGSVTFTALLGAALSGFAIPKVGLHKMFMIDTGVYFVGAICLLLISFVKAQKFSQVKLSIMQDLQFARKYLKSHKRAYYLVLMSMSLSLITAIFINALNTLAVDYYNLGIEGVAKLKTMLGVGVIVGMVVTIFLARFMKLSHLFAMGFITLCVALFTAPLCKTMNQAWFWMISIGIADTLILVMINTVLQKVIPDRVRGKIFGLQQAITTFAFLAGTMSVAFAADKINPLVIFKLVALFSLSIAAIVMLFDKSFRYFLLKATVGQIFLHGFRYKVEGLEYLPKEGKVILAGNHTGHLDPLIIQMATNRQLWFITGTPAFRMPVIKHFLKYFNVIPIIPKKGMEALEIGINKLKANEAVVIFPEGKFTVDGNINKFNRGVSVMAREAHAEIIPFAIHGGYETWGLTRYVPKFFNTLTIQFGQAIKQIDRDEKEIAKDLQNRVLFMKTSLDRRAFYKLNKKSYSDFLELIQEKSDIYGPVKALSLKTKDGYETMSYIELSRLAKNFGIHLIEEVKIERGDRIAILSESRPEFGIGMFASIQTGAITIPLDVKLTVSELTSILSDCTPRVLCVSSHCLETALQVKENVKSIEKIFILDNEKPEGCEIPSVFEIKSDLEKDLGRARSLGETALIVYTSGTTGNPKGVMISFGNIYSQLKDFEAVLKMNNKNTLVSILPLNHLLELNVGFFGMLYMGAKVVYIKSLSPKEISNVMKETKATNMLVVPLFVKMLKSSVEKEIRKQPKAAQDAFNLMYKVAKFMPQKVRRLMFKSVIDGFGGKLECFVCGGAPLDLDVAEFFERIGIPVYQGYGLTETSPTITTNYPNNNKSGSVGRPLPSVTVKIAENGEILATGPNLMQGYWGKPEMTAEVIDENGWFHTGDIGEIDKQGYLYITGRIKNMIVLGGGKKIFPEEVEAVLEKSPLIKELCVLALKIKSGNKAGTEEVGAVIVPSDDLAKKSDEEIQKEIEAEVKKLSEANLAPYKAPTVIAIHRDDLPKTSTRKVKRKDVLDWYDKIAINVGV